MMKQRLLLLPLILALIVPASVFAEAAIIQEACEIVPGYGGVLLHFSVVNFSLPSPVCCLVFTPEPQPVSPQCEVVDIAHPGGWSGFLNPFGGADFFANTPADCVATNDILSGFTLYLDLEPNSLNFCCYIVQFCDPAGAVMLEQEECFSCTIVPNEAVTWGTIKALYR